MEEARGSAATCTLSSLSKTVLALVLVAALLAVAQVAALSNIPRFLAKAGILAVIAVWIAAVPLPRAIGPERTRSALLGLALIVVSLAISLLLAEYVARAAFSDVTTTGHTSYFTRRYLKDNPPVVNRLGYRDREFGHEKPDGVYRIAVIGDSFTYGQGIRAEDRMTELMSRELAESANNIEILNFGKAGAETVDHLETLKHDVLPLAPDFVLLQWLSNDFEGADKSGRPAPARLVPSDTLAAGLNRYSALYYLANSAWGDLQQRVGLVASYTEYMERRFGDPDSEDSAAAAMEMNDFISIARDAGVGVGIVVFPRLWVTNGDGDYALGFLADRVMAICAARGIPCVDLRSAFSSASVPRAQLWANRLDSHPGRLANEIAAQAVLHELGPRWREAARRATVR